MVSGYPETVSAEPPEPTVLTGGCNCGAVRFEVTAPLASALNCWCKRCQRRSGIGGGPNARTVDGSFAFVGDTTALAGWDPGDGGWEKMFCGRCGSHLCARDQADHSRVVVRFGAFDEDPGIRPGLHQYVAYAAPWAPPPDDGLPRYPERAPAAGGSHPDP
jgi:hypothetical protein